ncbi:50S ribosomal protein L10, partial [Candidatus Gottesmanbacteria bacterium]|nr:50S ribosomal protein L10 [Candidatus Gottesmanbacteria bacterium]
MPKAKNIAVVASLKEKLARAKSLVLADYTGLTHKQAEELHKKARLAGGEFLVVKNSLLKIALMQLT